MFGVLRERSYSLQSSNILPTDTGAIRSYLIGSKDAVLVIVGTILTLIRHRWLRVSHNHRRMFGSAPIYTVCMRSSSATSGAASGLVLGGERVGRDAVAAVLVMLGGLVFGAGLV